MFRITRGRLGLAAAIPAVAALAIGGVALASPAAASDNSGNTTTPIKHVVEIFGENISFDHYFGTYPNAANTDGTPFTAKAGTPTPNNLVSANLLGSNNPNEYAPTRLTPAQALTCDQNHSYTPEQYAEDNGKMDKFVQNTSTDTCTGLYGAPGLAMDYYDGNTVTAEWNYAQNYAMSDNSWDTVFGPSTPGALNLISGQTHGAQAVDPATGAKTVNASIVGPGASTSGFGTLYGDTDPAFDDCSDNNHTATTSVAELSGKNIGDLLNEKGVTWGWFQGGFAPTTPWDGKTGDYAVCGKTSVNVGNGTSVDYSPHHNPFEYYKSTSNPHHLPPSSPAMIGHTDQANHQYDITSFDTALAQNNLPAVSFLKAPEAEDGHAAYSDPIDEQKFIVNKVNAIEKSPEWSSTAIIINYDDSDGWYDHQAPTILNGSKDQTPYTWTQNGVQMSQPIDSEMCSGTPAKSSSSSTSTPSATPSATGSATPTATASSAASASPSASASATASAASSSKSAPPALGGYEDRCGPSQRLPFLVISPFSKPNHIDHTLIEQTSALKFIEDNWKTGGIGDSSFDVHSGSIDGMFDFSHPQQNLVLLAPDGSVASTPPVTPTVDFSVAAAFSAPTVTAGHKVTLTESVTSTASSTEKIALSGSFAYTGGKGKTYTLKLPTKTVTVKAGSTSKVTIPIPVTKLLPKGSYAVTLNGKDATGTATATAKITVD